MLSSVYPNKGFYAPSPKFQRSAPPQEGRVRRLLHDAFVPVKPPLHDRYDVEVINGRKLTTEELDEIVDLMHAVLGIETGGKQKFIERTLEKWKEDPGLKEERIQFIRQNYYPLSKDHPWFNDDVQLAQELYRLDLRYQVVCAARLSRGALTLIKDPETGKPIATVLVNPSYNNGKASKKVCYLMGLAVHPDYRGQRLGKDIVEIMEKAASQLGYNYVTRRNVRGSIAYKRNIRNGNQPVYFNPLTPRVILDDCPKASYSTSVFLWKKLPAFNAFKRDDIVNPSLWGWIKGMIANMRPDIEREQPAGNEG